jgi:hypothetical protein
VGDRPLTFIEGVHLDLSNLLRSQFRLNSLDLDEGYEVPVDA